MDIAAIQQGLATAAATITGLNTFPALPESLNATPAFAVVEFDLSYDQTFAGGQYGMVETLFSCGVYTSRGGDAQADRSALVAFLNPSGASSIKAALEADRTLGGACRTLIVERVRGAYRLYTIGGTDYLGAVFDVRVWSTP